MREIIGKLEDPPTDLVRRDNLWKKLELTDDDVATVDQIVERARAAQAAAPAAAGGHRRHGDHRPTEGTGHRPALGLGVTATTVDTSPNAGEPSSRSKWALLATTLRAQRRNLIIGTSVGLRVDGRQDLRADPRALRDRPRDRAGRQAVALGQPRRRRRRARRARSPRSAASTPSARRAGPRPACASGCSATSCRCTSATTTAPRPVS